MEPIFDPRRGDFEDDASSTKRHSLLSLASSMLVEISLPKLALAWLLMLVVPSLLLGLAPLAATHLVQHGEMENRFRLGRVSGRWCFWRRSSRWVGLEAARCSSLPNPAFGH